MSRSKSMIIAIVLGCLFLLAVIIYVCFGASQQADANSNASEIQEVSVATTYPDRTLDEMISESSLIIYGTVVSASEPFAISPTNGGDASNFVDYTVSVQEDYRSDGAAPDSVAVRIQGGLVGNVNMVCENEPVLSIGDSYVFFLYQPGIGGGYNTAGDYYYVLGGENGVYSLDSGNTDTPNTAALTTEAGDSLSIADLSSKCMELNISDPPNENVMSEEFKNNLDKQLEDGYITQNEYNAALDESETYAEIVTE